MQRILLTLPSLKYNEAVMIKAENIFQRCFHTSNAVVVFLD